MAEQFVLAEAVIDVKARDSSSAVLDQSMKRTQASVQTTATVLRNSINSVTRALGSSIGPAISPLIGIGEGFALAADRAQSGSGRITAALQGVGLAGIAIGAELTLLNANEKQAQDQLAVAITNTGGSYDEQKGKIEETIKTQEKYGHTSIQTQQALNTLVNATHDTSRGIDLMGEAADIAAARHISLSNASSQLARALGGSGRLFKQFGIETQHNADGTLNLTKMNEELAKVLSGQAAAAADNWGGRLRHLGAYLEDTAAKVGKFGPVVTVAAGLMFTAATISQAWATHTANAALKVETALAQEAAVAQAAAEAQIKADEEQMAAADVAAQAQVKADEEQAAADAARAEAKIASIKAMEEAQLSFFTQTEAGTLTMAATTDAAYVEMDGAQMALFSTDKLGIISAEEAAAARIAANAALLADTTVTDTAIIAENEAVGASWLMALGPLAIVVGAVAAVGYGASKLAGVLDSATNAAFKEIKVFGDGMKQVQTDLEASGAKISTKAFDDVATALGGTDGNSGIAGKAAKAHITLSELTTGVTGTDKEFQKLTETWKAQGKPSDQTIFALEAMRVNFLKTKQAAIDYNAVQKQLAETAMQKLVPSDQANAASLSVYASALSITDKQASTYLATLGIIADKDGNYIQTNQEVSKSLGAVTHAYDTANLAQEKYLAAEDKFSKSAGSAADRAALIGATLVAANGDALGYAKTMAEATKAVDTMKDAFKKQADDISKGNLLYSESERAALTFATAHGKVTASINTEAVGASDLINQLQGIQTGADAAAQATYQHEVATQGATKAADDAYNVYVTKTRGNFIDAKGNLTDTAKAMGINKDQAHALADTYFGMPADVKTKIEQEGADSVVNILERVELNLRMIAEKKTQAQIIAEDKATGTMNAIETQLDRINHTVVTPTINVINGSAQSSMNAGMHQLPSGAWSYATGGKIHGPGGPVDDKAGIFALSDGEFVSTADATKRNEAALQAANKGATLVAIRKMATGGKAYSGWQPGDPYPTGEDPSITMSKIAKAKKAPKANNTFENLQWKIGGGSDSDFYKTFEHLFGAVSTLHGTLASMINDVRKAVLIGKAPGSLIGTLQAEDNQLIKEANQRAVIAGKLKAANAVLAADVKVYNKEVVDATTDAMGKFDLSTAGAHTTGASFLNLISDMQMQVKKTLAFAKELRNLQNLGLNKDLFAQLAAGGADSANAAVLQNATKDQVNQMNALYGQLHSAAVTTGTAVADEMYGAGVRAAQGMVNGLKSQEAALDKQMTRLADTMVNQIKKDLKIHSPSQVGHEIGNMFGEGIGGGLDKHVPKLQNRAGKLGAAMVNGVMGQFSEAGNGGVTNYYDVTFNVKMDEISEVQKIVNIIHGIPQAVRAGG